MFQPGGGPLTAEAVVPLAAAGGTVRHSNGLREFLNGWERGDGRRVLDLGCTSSANLNYFTSHGHSINSNDLLVESSRPQYLFPPPPDSADSAALEPGFDAAACLRDNLQFEPGHFDAVLLWDLADYVPEPLVRPLIQRLTEILKPSGAILAYFHTRDAGSDAVFNRYHIRDHETLLLRAGSNYRLQRVFNNRHVENLFQGYRTVKFFLSRDNLREVVAIR